MNAQEIMVLVAQLSQLAAAYAPGKNTAALVALLQVGARLNDMIQQIRRQDPEAWNTIRNNYGDALARFEASVEAKKGE